MARTPNAVLSGPGYYYYGPEDEAAPAAAGTDPSTDPGGNWEDVGYTDDGVSLEWDLTYEDIVVAESAAALRTLWTEAEYRLAAVIAQFEAETLNLALNGDASTTITAIAGPPVEESFVPPDVGTDIATALFFSFTNEFGFQSFVHAPSARNTASTSIPFTKAPQKSVIGLEHQLQVPSAGDIWTLRQYISAS